MTMITPEDRILQTTELLQSLQGSVRALRQRVEELKDQIETGEDADFNQATKALASTEGLVRACQKVEANLVEQQNRKAGIAQGGYALDLERARSEIGCRLARLRRCCGAGSVSD